MATSIAKASLHLTTESSGLTKGLKDAEKKISGFSLSLGKGVDFFTTGPMGSMLAGFRTATNLAEGFANKLEDLGGKSRDILNMANIMGMTAEETERLQYAAKDSNIEFEAMGKLLRSAAEFAGASDIADKELLKKIKPLGLDIGDLQGMKPQQALSVILDRLSKIGDESQRLAMATDIFGGRNANTALIAMKENTLEYAKTLEGAGVTLDNFTHKRLADMGDRMAFLARQWEVFKANLIVGFTDHIDPKGLVFGKTFKTTQDQIDEITAKLTKLYEMSDIPRRAAEFPADKYKNLSSSLQSEFDEQIGKFIQLDEAISVLEAKLRLLRDDQYADYLDQQEVAAAAASAQMEKLNEAMNRVVDTQWREEMKMNIDILEALHERASKFLAPDPIKDFNDAIKALTNDFTLSAEQFDLGFLQAYNRLKDVAKLSKDLQLPSANFAGSAGAISSISRMDANRRFGVGKNESVEGVIEAIMKQRDADRENSRRVQEEIKQLPGGLANVFKQI